MTWVHNADGSIRRSRWWLLRKMAERQILAEALREAHGDWDTAAGLLTIHRNLLRNMCRGLDRALRLPPDQLSLLAIARNARKARPRPRKPRRKKVRHA